MSKKDVAKLLYIVKANYPKYYKNMAEHEFESMINAWFICISDYDYNFAQVGVKAYLTSETNGFPPSVGQIIDCIHKIFNKNDNMSELDAWGFVMKAVGNSNYNAETEFEKMPDVVRIAVGNPERLREWAKLEINDVQTVIQSNFMRTFRAVQSQRRDYNKMPSDIKKIIEEHMGYSKSVISVKEVRENGDKTKLDVKDIISSTPEYIESLLKDFKSSIYSN